MFSSKLKIKGNRKILEAYFAALSPEQDFKSERANYTLELQDGKLIINIKAKDGTSFRAIMNTLTGIISIVDKNIKLVEEK